MCTGYLAAWALGDSTLQALLGRMIRGNAGDDWHQRVEQLIDVLRETPRQRRAQGSEYAGFLKQILSELHGAVTFYILPQSCIPTWFCVEADADFRQ